MAFLVEADLPAGMGESLGLTPQQMINDALALAMLAAPCLAINPTELTENQANAVKAVLRGAIMRWSEAGTGALQSQNAGPFGQTIDTRQQRRGMFWPSEIQQLQNICGGVGQSEAFYIDTTPTSSLSGHQDYCSINFGATYCSCGYVLTAGLYYP